MTVFSACSKEDDISKSKSESESEYAYLFRSPLHIPNKYKAIIGSWAGDTGLCIMYFDTYLEDGTLIKSVRHTEPYGNYHKGAIGGRSICSDQPDDSDDYMEYRIFNDMIVVKVSDDYIWTAHITELSSVRLNILGVKNRVNSVPPIGYWR